MKTSKIGEINFGQFETEIHTTPEVKALFKKEKTSLSALIPTPWEWYDSELVEVADEDGDGKIDEKFGKSFKIVYITNDTSTKEFEQTAITIVKTAIKNIRLKYVVLKN